MFGEYVVYVFLIVDFGLKVRVNVVILICNFRIGVFFCELNNIFEI